MPGFPAMPSDPCGPISPCETVKNNNEFYLSYHPLAPNQLTAKQLATKEWKSSIMLLLVAVPLVHEHHLVHHCRQLLELPEKEVR